MPAADSTSSADVSWPPVASTRSTSSSGDRITVATARTATHDGQQHGGTPEAAPAGVAAHLDAPEPHAGMDDQPRAGWW